MAIPMDVVLGQLQQTCFTGPQSEQARANAIAQALQVTFPLTATALNYGIATPNVDQQALPWIRLNSDGTLDGLYVFSNGFWLRPNPVPPSSQISYFWRDSLANLAIYDGGEGTYNVNNFGTANYTITPSIAITATTGPMWQPDPGMYGEMPIGLWPYAQINDVLGNPIIGYTSVGATGGEVQHTLTVNELAPHTHGYASVQVPSPGGNYGGGSSQANTAQTTVTGGVTIASGATNVPIGHNNMPPYITGYWIQRTQRINYRINA